MDVRPRNTSGRTDLDAWMGEITTQGTARTGLTGILSGRS